MKLLIKIFICLSFVLLFFSSFCFIRKSNIFASKTYFAQIVESNVYLYNSTNTTDNNSKLFVLPQTYFVELLKSANESLYYCTYNGIYGYVIKSQVKPIKNTPTTPNLTNITFRVFVPGGANLRSTPYNLGTNNLLFSIPFLETNLSYLGLCEGEEAISKKGVKWYYCRYYQNNIYYEGYVYSPLCDCLSPIPLNDEPVEFLENEPTFDEETIPTGTNSIDSMSSTAQTIIIIAVSLPCLLFIYLLFKPTRLAEQKEEKETVVTHKRKKVKKLKGSDYYEFDDDINF